MKEKIEEILSYAKSRLEEIDSTTLCQALRVEILGKSGKITELFRFLKEVPQDQKGVVGQLLNGAKQEVESLIKAKEAYLANLELEKEINSAEKIDITLPCEDVVGSLHPRTIIQKQIEDVFISMGFVVEDEHQLLF